MKIIVYTRSEVKWIVWNVLTSNKNLKFFPIKFHLTYDLIFDASTDVCGMEYRT